MHSGPRLVLGLLLLTAVLLTTVAPLALGRAYPTYTLGDFWEYEVEARLDALLGIGNVSGSLVAEGLTRAEVVAVTNDEATLSWAGDLTLQGRFALPGETVEATITGTVETTYEERRQAPYFLPVAFDARTAFDGVVSFIVSVPYTARLDLNATFPPTPSSLTYPLEEGEGTFTTAATLASNLTVSFPLLPGMGFQNDTEEEVTSTVQWNITPTTSVEVPAGTFSGLPVTMEPLTGFVPSAFQALIPGTIQVTHHSASVGSPVLFRFLANDTEVGSASLETYSYASSVTPPLWQNPLFIGGLLAVPIALLVFRYWRERQKGL